MELRSPRSQANAAMDMPARSDEAQAIVMIKAAPQVSQRHGETVCCAGIDLEGRWLRLYPISFRILDQANKFERWDRIKFRWRLPNDDRRVESRRVDQNSLRVLGNLKPAEREKFLASSIVTSLDKELEEGKSLALLKAEILDFNEYSKSAEDIKKEAAKFDALRTQPDLFRSQPLIPHKPCPYHFKYRYRTDDGEREGTCQDWEIVTTYNKWSRRYGEDEALTKVKKVFGEVYPKKGMLLAMGTHSRYPDRWLINGSIRLNEIEQLSLF